MAIKSYVCKKTGEPLFMVVVNVRSKTNLSIRKQRKVQGIKSRRDALRMETSLIRECERELLEIESQGESWGAVVEAWKKYINTERKSDLAETTRLDYIAALNNHTKAWMKRPAASITTMDVKELLGQLKAQGGTHEFLKKTKNMLCRVFNFGIETRMIKGLDMSPTVGITLDRPEEKKPEILSTTEIRKLLADAKAYKSPWYPIWAMAVLTGMRNGELYALLWSDIDWENKTLSVNKSYCSRLKLVKSTKGGYWRTVPISSELMSLLKAVKAQAGDRSHLLPRLREWQMGMQAEELRKFCLGVGLTSIRFHTLRACFATQLVRNGVPTIQVQKICGWKDLKTMQRYIRLAGIEIDGATETLKVLPDPLPEGTGPVVPVREQPVVQPQIAAQMQSMASSWLPNHLTT